VVQAVQELTSTNYVPSPVLFIFRMTAPGMLFCLYSAWNVILFVFINCFFVFHSEELKRENIAEFDTVPGCRHSLKLGLLSMFRRDMPFPVPVPVAARSKA
jgi:hypothetical protein